MEYADDGDLFQRINDLQSECNQMNENEVWTIFI